MYAYAFISLLGMLLLLAFWLGDFNMLWNTKDTVVSVYHVGLRDYYFWGLCISPSIISHFVTVWGHYYRADSIFQRSISRVSWPVSQTAEQRRAMWLNEISTWDKRDPWVGFSYKYWVLVFIATTVNLVWFFQPWVNVIGRELAEEEGSPAIVWGAYIGYGSGYAAMGSCGMILFLVLRRSMLHTLGFTYADLLPLHRGMGFAFIFWSVVHTIGYMVHIIMENALASEINFDGATRGPQNIVGFVALAAVIALGILSIPYVRRRFYVLFLVSHRYLTIITFAGTLMHYPYFMIWYYVIPSMCLFLTDRFVPKIVQSFSVAPEVICTFTDEADILTIVITSSNRLEPLKPYYPGDYISLQLRPISEIYHPFTIASYWAEDPYSMTLFIRTFGEHKSSWTHAVSGLCGPGGEPVMLPMAVEGVFGDRRHDYLCSDVVVIYAAGAAITTFMPLIKSIAAQIDAKSAPSEPQRSIKVYLICTFRYESELYAYGDFLHQITHDARFTSWLWTDIYVSRSSKSLLHTITVDAELVYGGDEKIKVNTSSDSSTDVDADTLSIEPVQLDAHRSEIFAAADIASKKEHGNGGERYVDRPLPTFLASDAAAVSTIHAKRDLLITAAMLLIPFGAFIGLRYVGWEGTWNGESYWCRTTQIYDQNMTNKCMWNYTMTPGVLHIVTASIIGYLLIFVARRSSRLDNESKESADDQAKYIRSVLASQLATPDGSIRFKPMRLDVEKSIQELIANEVGMTSHKRDGMTTAVFVGGPDSFLDSVERSSKKAAWSVEFHRETWSP